MRDHTLTRPHSHATTLSRDHTLGTPFRYIHDKNADELWSMQGEVNLRFPASKGLAGQCLKTGEVINIPEAYEDDRFNQASDKKTGYRTRTILCMPIKGAKPEFKTIGVIQVINKKEGPFNAEDEQLLKSFFNIAGEKEKDREGERRREKAEKKREAGEEPPILNHIQLLTYSPPYSYNVPCLLYSHSQTRTISLHVNM